jgi:N,N-dimethylformamidase
MNPMNDLTGYADRLSASPGETIAFMLSSPSEEYEASIVRLTHGDDNPHGPGLQEELVASVEPLRLGRLQHVRPGSYLVIPDTSGILSLQSFTITAWVWPTTPDIGREQGLVSKWSYTQPAGYALLIDSDGKLCLRVGQGDGRFAEVHSPSALRSRSWYFIAATVDRSARTLELSQYSASPWATAPDIQARTTFFPQALEYSAGPLLVGAGGARTNSCAVYNGKIDRPAIFGRPLSALEICDLRLGISATDVAPRAVAAAWDLGARPDSTTVVDLGRHSLFGELVNMPTRAVTGYNWTGRESDFRLAPDEYGAIHFHSDDVGNAQWSVDVEWPVPPGARSDVYALRVETDVATDRIPFIVRPSDAREPSAAILVVVPTMTYVAYANLPLDISSQPNRPPDWVRTINETEVMVRAHPEFGSSLYQVHEDTSGIIYSSFLRPIPTLRPTYRPSFIDGARHLGAELYLIDWLNRLGFQYDVVVDDDVHANGLNLLEKYRVVITGSHPEYTTQPMLEAVETFVARGGRLMYLGGNGFYWVTSVSREQPHIIEVRRGIAGTRPWESEPGELHHSTTGELGGLWRFRGQLPNRLLGIGFAAQGVGRCKGYRRSPESHRDDVSFIFDGVGSDELIGSFGLVMGGAVGDELDRADRGLGTPPEAVVLASSVDVDQYYGLCFEDEVRWLARRDSGEPRADMVYLINQEGGAVFSVGSISWTASLSHENYRNNVSRITQNVLERFLQPSLR